MPVPDVFYYESILIFFLYFSYYHDFIWSNRNYHALGVLYDIAVSSILGFEPLVILTVSKSDMEKNWGTEQDTDEGSILESIDAQSGEDSRSRMVRLVMG